MPAPSPAPPVDRRDFYAEAVLARRAELRDQRSRLAGYRSELRAELALARITEAAGIATDLARLGREIRDYTDRAGRSALTALPELVTSAALGLDADAGARRAAMLAGVRMIAGVRGLLADPRWPQPGCPGPGAGGVALPSPAAPRGVLDGIAAWRLALPIAVASTVGLPMSGIGEPAVALPATAVITGALAAVLARRSAADRARWRAWGEDAVAGLRVRASTDLDTWLLDLETRVLGDLDRAATRAAARIDAELALLTPEHDGAR